MFAGVDQSILRSTRNPLLNQEDSRCTTSRSSAARSLLPFIRASRSARIATRSLVPPGARLSRRISSCRRGSEAKCRSLASSSFGCARQALDRLRQLFAVRTEIARQRFEEGQPAGGVEVVVAVEHLARHRGAGGFAAARQQRLAQFEQFGGVLPGVGRLAAAKQRAAAFGNRREKVGEEGVGHGRVESSDYAESYTGFRAMPITIKRIGSYGNMSCLRSMRQDDGAHSFPANSVGVLPVTCRKAWENAGTLA